MHKIATFRIQHVFVASVMDGMLDGESASELAGLVADAAATGARTYVLEIGSEVTHLAISTLRVLARIAGRSAEIRIWGLDAISQAVIAHVGLSAVHVFDDVSAAMAA